MRHVSTHVSRKIAPSGFFRGHTTCSYFIFYEHLQLVQIANFSFLVEPLFAEHDQISTQKKETLTTTKETHTYITKVVILQLPIITRCFVVRTNDNFTVGQTRTNPFLFTSFKSFVVSFIDKFTLVVC